VREIPFTGEVNRLYRAALRDAVRQESGGSGSGTNEVDGTRPLGRTAENF
jgi:hypothetical protein